jgi:hypothetical protein
MSFVSREEVMPLDKNGGKTKALKAMLGYLRYSGNKKVHDGNYKTRQCNSRDNHQLTAKSATIFWPGCRNNSQLGDVLANVC